MLLAAGIAFGGVGGVLFNLRAPHLTAEGTLFDVALHHGKNSSTRFCLRTSTEEIDDLTLSGAYGDLVDGEIAEVTYQSGSRLALHVKVLEGPYAGFDHAESDGLMPSWMAVVLAIALATYGVLDWLNDGTATSSDPGNQSAPDGDVDSQSMLNI